MSHRMRIYDAQVRAERRRDQIAQYARAKRGFISLNQATHDALSAWCKKNGESMASVVERLMEDLC